MRRAAVAQAGSGLGAGRAEAGVAAAVAGEGSAAAGFLSGWSCLSRAASCMSPSHTARDRRGQGV